ncbi:glycosyltransferase [Halorhabdus rudnickae]|uniref:glycosyltransferase n=1 Tax=Halorhabdus rudnickae TaxID=1775544 RepID=UPI0010832B37|nr:glycosyltransferase family 2 protein [Halorhabdus rudnickae]
MSVQSPRGTAASPDPQANRQTSVSVVIPTYNERENVQQVVRHCLDALATYDIEVIVVDDDSPDGTWKFARECFTTDDRVRVIRRREQSGLATAIARGFRAASAEYCTVIDADLQHPPAKIAALLEALEAGADVAIGSRYTDSGGIENWSWYRRAVSGGASAVASVCVPEARSLADPMSGFFAIRQSVVESVELDPTGYKMLLEVLVKGDYDSVVEVPYVFRERERGDSKLSAGEYVAFLEHVLALGFTSRGMGDTVDAERAVQMVEFGAIGAIGALLNMAVFALAHDVTGVHYVAAGIVAFLVALHGNFVGNWLLTFDRPPGRLRAQYLRFHAVSIGGFVVYTAVLSGSVELIGLPALGANAVAILAGSIINYIGSEQFAFRPKSVRSRGEATGQG